MKIKYVARLTDGYSCGSYAVFYTREEFVEWLNGINLDCLEPTSIIDVEIWSKKNAFSKWKFEEAICWSE